MNLQEEMLKIKNEMIDEFDKRVEALKVDEQEFPQEDDFYWYVDPTGRALIGEWEGFNIAKDMLDIGNIYKTNEEAEFAAEKLKVEAELRKFSTSFVLYNENWFLALADTQQDVMPLYEHRNVTQGAIYFESEKKAQQAIEAVGEERIKKYIFGVED